MIRTIAPRIVLATRPGEHPHRVRRYRLPTAPYPGESYETSERSHSVTIERNVINDRIGRRRAAIPIHAQATPADPPRVHVIGLNATSAPPSTAWSRAHRSRSEAPRHRGIPARTACRPEDPVAQPAGRQSTPTSCRSTVKRPATRRTAQTAGASAGPGAASNSCCASANDRPPDLRHRRSRDTICRHCSSHSRRPAIG